MIKSNIAIVPIEVKFEPRYHKEACDMGELDKKGWATHVESSVSCHQHLTNSSTLSFFFLMERTIR